MMAEVRLSLSHMKAPFHSLNWYSNGIPPAPTGTPRIQLSVSMNKHLTEIMAEAVERLSGAHARRPVERDLSTYGDGALEQLEEVQVEY